MNKKTKRVTKKHVLSVRIDENEWELLQNALQKSDIGISALLRQGVRKFLETAR